jgi:uroporphyrin-III C-methyltransferase/precorrin-2 dehydrogenase/sirohydrochlorin ferrochelatase
MTLALIDSRPSTEAQPPRMEPLARLPVFFALEGRRAVVAGGVSAAAWKAELLSAAGAEVAVFAADPCEEIYALAAGPPGGVIVVHRRIWQAADFAGAAMAVGACESDEEAARFAKAARTAGVPVNVIDKPAFCDFAFGAIVNRSPLVIGISTDGAAPAFGQAIRSKLEGLIPRGFAAWAEAARRWRSALRTSGLSFDARRQFWRTFAAIAMRNPERPPEQTDYDRFLADAATGSTLAAAGSVAWIDAGPGDPDLMTLRAVRTLQSADIILFDPSVSPDILEFARREAKKMLVSNEWDNAGGALIGLAKTGRRVVRIAASDSPIEGELAACRKAGVAIEVVPSVRPVPSLSVLQSDHQAALRAST